MKFVKIQYEFAITDKGRVVIKGDGWMGAIPDKMCNIGISSSLEVDIKAKLNSQNSLES